MSSATESEIHKGRAKQATGGDLDDITDQIDANISRTAFSPYIYEYKDFAVGLVGADGELIALDQPSK